MKQFNDNKQMKDVWTLPAIAPWEKSCKKHPTQKPLSVLTRLILASTKPNAWILDPFAGSSTTGIAANLTNRRYLGIDQEKDYLEISKNRKLEIENPKIAESYTAKIKGFNAKNEFKEYLQSEPVPLEKVVLGYCRKNDLKKLKKQSAFYFHAIEGNTTIRDFPYGIYDASQLFIYSGGRGNPLLFSGFNGKIKTIKLKHKSKIKGKEKSKTEYYYEIELEKGFQMNEEFTGKLNLKKLFDKNDTSNLELLKSFLPAITTLNKLKENFIG